MKTTHDTWKWLKTLYFHARPVAGDVTLYRNTPVYKTIDLTFNMHVQDFTIFTNSCFCSLYGDNDGIVYKTISVWYNNATNQDCKALQRVVRLAERISGSALPSLQAIYIKRSKSRAAKILKDSTHPGNHLFCLLPSGRRFRSMMAKTERLRKSFFPQAIRLLNSNSAS